MSSTFDFTSPADVVKIKFIVIFAEHLHRHSRQRPFKVISKNIYLIIVLSIGVVCFAIRVAAMLYQ